MKVYEDVKLQSLFPHMHVRGKAFEYRATYPTGESQVLLSVPSYDFNWQLTYDLAEPSHAAQGYGAGGGRVVRQLAEQSGESEPQGGCLVGRSDVGGDAGGIRGFRHSGVDGPHMIARPAKKQVASN